MIEAATTLGDRMGIPVHQSPLRFKIQRWLYGAAGREPLTPEDWLVELANRRGATVVFHDRMVPSGCRWPERHEFSDEELVVALCQLNCADRPQLLRLPAQLISRGQLNLEILLHLARLERASRTLKELSTQALKVEAYHPAWSWIAKALPNEKPFREPLIHWTRLAEPLFAAGRPNPIGWKLVA